jgi:hypothetical protein
VVEAASETLAVAIMIGYETGALVSSKYVTVESFTPNNFAYDKAFALAREIASIRALSVALVLS